MCVCVKEEGGKERWVGMKRKNRNARPPAFSATHKGGRKVVLSCSYCMEASAGLNQSTLFCKIIILARRIISTAARRSIRGRKGGKEGGRATKTYLLVLHGSIRGLNEVHLILQDDNIGQTHDLDSS